MGLTEADTCRKLVLSKLLEAGRDIDPHSIAEQRTFTDGRIYFRTPSVRPCLGGGSTGTNVRHRRLNPQIILRREFPLPSMCRQRQLQSVRARMDELKRLQVETQKELDALVPSILDRAFKGEL
jgi:hypothetical protein